MSEPRYPYVHVDVSASDLELVASELFELGALGLEERDASTLLPSAAGAQATTLVASFADEASALAAHAQLVTRHPARVEHVVGDAWRDGWRAYFKPLRVGERLVVRPSWEDYAPRPGDVVITLDPGQAFGTGTHESTQLILAALPESLPAALRVLDVGTGSGILAIACLLLGAERVIAVDSDALSVVAAAANAGMNGVAARLQVSDTPIERMKDSYDLVLANIEARVLIPLARVLAARVADGGRLILSGLLHADADAVRDAYPEFSELERPMRGDWCALVLQKPTRGA
jgi:ribosomal protein L11 methyltransferase